MTASNELRSLRRPGRPGQGTTRAIADGLRSLRAAAPPSLAERIVRRAAPASYAEMDGPIGPIYVAWGDDGVLEIERAGDPQAFEEAFRARHGRPARYTVAVPASMARAIRRRMDGDRGARVDFDLSALTEFEQAVLHKTLEIPRGEVRPYSWVASEIGRPKAVRAVGSALAGNPIPFVIPCHRVVRADGRIGEYGAGGPASKRAVLAAEGLDTAELERFAAAGFRYLGSDTTKIACYPTCHAARRITPPHRVPFRSLETAELAGYRACLACRPVAAPARAA